MAAWKGIIGKAFTPDTFDKYVKSLKFTTWRPQFVVLHNTGIPRLSQWHSISGKQRMKNLEHYYRDVEGWTGGPHLFIADDFIWAFTPLTVSGVHSPSWNLISWGVEMVGDFSLEVFNKDVRDNTAAALATLHSALGIDSHTLKFHKEDPRTTHKDCPGRNVDKNDMIQRIHNILVLRNGHGEHQPNKSVLFK